MAALVRIAGAIAVIFVFAEIFDLKDELITFVSQNREGVLGFMAFYAFWYYICADAEASLRTKRHNARQAKPRRRHMGRKRLGYVERT